MKKLILLCSAAAVMPTAAFAQSTGTQEFEQEAIIVTGTRAQDVGGVKAPDTSKAKAVLTQEFISRQNPGQTVLDTINAIPGVSFQNNDAYGSSGGTLTIRGFSADRVSLTFDGIPLNDSGNYAIYSNQQVDPELIDQVNVNLGSTDVDTPTASAVGGTVNINTRLPHTEFGGRVAVSLGEFDFRRLFAVVDTGEVGPWGTRAYFAVSNSKNDNPFNNYGKVDKQQYNAKIYQPIGSNGDFVSLSGHYNRNRNNFFGSVTLRNDAAAPAVPGSFPDDADDREYDILYPCTIDVPEAGTRDRVNGCGNEFDRRYNPSNTGNIKATSRFTLTDKLTLTVEPSYQYVMANGGGTVIGREGFRNIGGVNYTGFIGGNYYFGRDLNGDGDVLDTCRFGAGAGGACSSSASATNDPSGGVRLIAPSQTRTHRFGLISGLRYEINDDHVVRVAYTWDRANHRQTGEVGFLQNDGEPQTVYPIEQPVHDVFGFAVQKRDRQSYAILNKFAAEWRGEFMGDRLTVNVGASLPFFKRDLENYCFTTSANGFVDCFGGNQSAVDQYAAAFPGFSPPQHRVLKYDKLLPNVGLIFDVTPRISAFANYSKNISVPSTDNLYNAFFFDEDAEGAKPNPELTDSVDGGLRYRSGKLQAQVAGWFTKFTDRTASAYDPELNASVFRNLGRVDKYGLDGSIAYAPLPQFTVMAFGSVMRSKIKDNIQVGALPAGTSCDSSTLTFAQRMRSCAMTAGKYEGGSPKYSYGASAIATLGPVDLGVSAKRTGPRYIYDTNEPILSGDVDNPAGIVELFPAKTPAYWLVNLDARFNMKFVGLKQTYFQLNVYNLFDEVYVGGFTSGLNQTVSCASPPGSCLTPVTGGTFGSAPFAQMGAPRTISGTFNIEF